MTYLKTDILWLVHIYIVKKWQEFMVCDISRCFTAGPAVDAGVVWGLGHPTDRLHAGKRIFAESTLWLPPRWYVLHIQYFPACLIIVCMPCCTSEEKKTCTKGKRRFIRGLFCWSVYNWSYILYRIQTPAMIEDSHILYLKCKPEY